MKQDGCDKYEGQSAYFEENFKVPNMNIKFYPLFPVCMSFFIRFLYLGMVVIHRTKAFYHIMVCFTLLHYDFLFANCVCI